MRQKRCRTRATFLIFRFAYSAFFFATLLIRRRLRHSLLRRCRYAARYGLSIIVAAVQPQSYS